MAKEQKPAEVKEVAEGAVAPEAAPAVEQGPFVHSLRFHLTSGEQFTLNEITNSSEAPQNVVAFINAWREMKDVWHSPNNDPHFGVRVRDVALYEYQVARAQTKEEAEAAKKAQEEAKAEAK